MKTFQIKLCLSLILILSAFSADLICEDTRNLPDSIIYKKKYNDSFIGYGIDTRHNENTFIQISSIKSAKISNLVYFTMDNNFLGSITGVDKYFAVTICPGISLIKYFGDSFRIYESTTFGLSYISVNNKQAWSNFGYCAGLRFGIGYWRLSLETSFQHYGHKQVSLSPLSLGIRVNTDGWF